MFLETCLQAKLLFIFLKKCSCSHTFWLRVLCNVNGMHSSKKPTWIDLAFGAPKTCERVVVERWKQQRSHEKPMRLKLWPQARGCRPSRLASWVFGEQINVGSGSDLNILWIASVRIAPSKGWSTEYFRKYFCKLLRTCPQMVSEMKVSSQDFLIKRCFAQSIGVLTTYLGRLFTGNVIYIYIA